MSVVFDVGDVSAVLFAQPVAPSDVRDVSIALLVSPALRSALDAKTVLVLVFGETVLLICVIIAAANGELLKRLMSAASLLVCDVRRSGSWTVVCKVLGTRTVGVCSRWR